MAAYITAFLSDSNNCFYMLYHISISVSTIFSFLFLFHLLFLIFFPETQLGTMFNWISLQPAFDCSISLKFTTQKLFTKLQTTFKTRKEMMRNNGYNLFKKAFFNIKFLPYPDNISIYLVGFGSQAARNHWHFLERFLQLSYFGQFSIFFTF